jgi:hypothetical protein
MAKRQQRDFKITRRKFLAAGAAVLCGPSIGARAAAEISSIREACKDMFLIGTALDFRTPNEFMPAELDLIKSQFNVITPEQAIENYKALQLKVAITELDVTMTGAGGGQLGGQQGNVVPPSAEALAAQADVYAKLFSVFVKHRDAIDRVTFWGLNDRRSWRRGQNPLVFDGDNQPKPALQAIIDAVKKAR